MRLINRRPDRVTSWLLPSLPFLIGLAIYLLTSESRHASNPSDKLLPSFTQMGAALRELALEPNLRTGDGTVNLLAAGAIRPATRVRATDAHATRATPVTSAQAWKARVRAARYWAAGT